MLTARYKAFLDGLFYGAELMMELPKKPGRKKERSLIGQLGGGKDNLDGFTDIAISFERVLKEGNAKYVLSDPQ